MIGFIGLKKGRLLYLGDKQKIQDIINALRINPVDYIDKEVLNSVTKIVRTREKKAGNWEIMQFVGRLFNTQRASVVVMRS